MKKPILLFDVDGTLTPPRLAQPDDVRETIRLARAAGFTVAIVGGSDFAKQAEQLGSDVLEQFDYIFSENGLVSYKQGVEIHRESLLNFLGNERVMKFVKKTLHLIADLDIPVQRGTFVEFRNGMINISPIGRNCSQAEREAFAIFDKEHKVRPKLIEELQRNFPDYGLQYSIGGQISIDVFPQGWDKTYCLQFVEKEYDEIHFFGDKVEKGGNDYEIFNDKRTIGHQVSSYKDTINEVKRIIESHH